MNDLEIKPVFMTHLGHVKAEEYRSSWADIAIMGELLRATNYRRKAMLLAFEEWFKNFSDEWSVSHAVRVSREVGFDHLLLHRQTYQAHLIDITFFYPTKHSTTPAKLTLPFERVISKPSMVEYLEDFCADHVRLISETFLVDGLKLMNKIINAFGPGYKIMKGAPNQAIVHPHVCFKIESEIKNDFFVAVAFIAPLR